MKTEHENEYDEKTERDAINRHYPNGKIICVSCKVCAKPIYIFGKRACDVCRNRKYRLENPEMYAYQNLRSSARKRNIIFSLTFEDFRLVIKDTDYMKLKSKTKKDGLTIDRIIEEEGYIYGNLQVITRKKNSEKSGNNIFNNTTKL